MPKYKSTDERVSDKVKKLLKEGKPKKQAAAQAINMVKDKKRAKSNGRTTLDIQGRLSGRRRKK